jgi:hypothetical protein
MRATPELDRQRSQAEENVGEKRGFFRSLKRQEKPARDDSHVLVSLRVVAGIDALSN